MDNTVSAAEANRLFSSVLRRVRQGASVLITSHGRPVARLVPYREEDDVAVTAREALFDRLARTPAAGSGKWTRDELHDR